jgi:hypothetical protein
MLIGFSVHIRHFLGKAYGHMEFREQRFSDFNVRAHHLGVLFKWEFRFGKSRVGSKRCISDSSQALGPHLAEKVGLSGEPETPPLSHVLSLVFPKVTWESICLEMSPCKTNLFLMPTLIYSYTESASIY